MDQSSRYGTKDSLVSQLNHGDSRIWKDLVIVYYLILELTALGLGPLSWDSVAWVPLLPSLLGTLVSINDC